MHTHVQKIFFCIALSLLFSPGSGWHEVCRRKNQGSKAECHNITQDCNHMSDYGLYEDFRAAGPGRVCEGGSTINCHILRHFNPVQLNGWNIYCRFEDIVIDFQLPISNHHGKGAYHDPRFQLLPEKFFYQCDTIEKTKYFKGVYLFNSLDEYVANTVFKPVTNLADVQQECEYNFRTPVVVIARRDDHNPFFMFSIALNAWITARNEGWADYKVLFFDNAEPKFIALFRALFGSHLIFGSHLTGLNKVCFSNMIFAPSEYTGPLMMHLMSPNPCGESQLLQDFRRVVLTALSIPTLSLLPSHTWLHAPPADQVIVSFISRRNTPNRIIERRLLNEEEIIRETQRQYPRLSIQAYDFATMGFKEQVETVARSHVLIGMHGAGLAHILWLSNNAHVIEIFPEHKIRLSYAHTCAYMGVSYTEYRGGEDVGQHHDKQIPVVDWSLFFQGWYQKAFAVKDEL